jgi:hypothetical protein
VVPSSGGWSKHFEGEDFLKTLRGAVDGSECPWLVCGSVGALVGCLWSWRVREEGGDVLG